MSEASRMLSAGEMRRRYGDFYDRNPKRHLDRGKVPEMFWPLLPYAEFWGVADDLMRENLVKGAPADARQDLKEAVALFDLAMDDWLAGPEADDTRPSDEYVAYSAMRMAADYI
jgi:hypothetical protein